MGKKTGSDSTGEAKAVVCRAAERAPEDRPEMFEDFNQFVTHYTDLLRDTQKNALVISWGIGQHIDALLEKSKYGDHTMEEVEKLFELSSSTLYMYRQLYQAFEWETFRDKVVAKGFPWRVLKPMLPAPPAVRERLLDLVCDGVDIDEAVKRISLLPEAPDEAGEGEEAPKARSKKDRDEVKEAAGFVKKRVGKIDGRLDLLADDLESLGDDFEQLVSKLDILAEDESVYSDIQERLEESAVRAREVSGILDQYSKQLWTPPKE